MRQEIIIDSINYSKEEIMNILVSACLLGLNVRYDGGNKFLDNLNELKEKHNLIPVCPEIFGGMTTPREPSEIVGDYVINKVGKDVTDKFINGAEETLKLAKFYDCKYAILKKNSPSCGYGKIYDGTFMGSVIDGNGIAAELLANNGVIIFNETNIDEIYF